MKTAAKIKMFLAMVMGITLGGSYTLLSMDEEKVSHPGPRAIQERVGEDEPIIFEKPTRIQERDETNPSGGAPAYARPSKRFAKNPLRTRMS